MPRRLPAALAVAAALSLAAPAGASAACADTEVLPAADTLPAVASATVCLLNEERAARGLQPVSEHPALTRASLAYSQRLVAESFFAHEAPDGTDVVDRLKATGYITPSAEWEVGENLAWAEGVLASPRNVVKAWMDSPGHRENILAAGYREVGIGVVLGTPAASADGSTFTTNFGRRESAASEGRYSDAFGAERTSAAKATPTAKAKAAKARAKKARARRGTARRSRVVRAAKRRAAVRRARAAKAARAARARG